MPHCYDLVGTLANVSYPGENLGTIIYTPRGPFTIITAQSAGSHNKLYDQVREAFPNVTRIHTVKTGTDKQEGQRKAATLARLLAHSYTDNNTAILDEIHRLLPSLKLYHMTGGNRKAYRG